MAKKLKSAKKIHRFIFVSLLLFNSNFSFANEINDDTKREAKQLQIILDTAKLAAVPQIQSEMNRGKPPLAFVASVNKMKRVQDLKKLVFILHTMMEQNSEAGLTSLFFPLETCFYFTINSIASKHTREAQDGLDEIRMDCNQVGDAGGSLEFRQICRNNKMKCLKLPLRIAGPVKKVYEQDRN